MPLEAYKTRCYKCGLRVTVSDELRTATITDSAGMAHKVKTFDVDAIIASEHKCQRFPI